MWSKKLLVKKGSFPSSCRVLLGCFREYGYIHVPQKKPPHILGPGHLWRKCFMVHPLTEISDPLTKYQWLTKSTLVKGLPESITSHSPPSNLAIEDLEQRTCEFLAHQVRKPYSGRGLYSPRTISGLFQSMLTSIWLLASDHWHLRSSHMTLEPKVETYWRRNGENYISRTRPLYIMHTNMALGLFCDPSYVGEGLPPLQYTPRQLSLFKHSFDQILPFGGSRRFSPFSLAHTLFIVDQKNTSPEQLYTHGLLQLFAQSAADAVQNEFKIDRDLPYPLVTQGIVTNGKTFTFMCFQLNTLDFREDSDNGKCNVFWAGPSLDLFGGVVPGEGLEGFNESCAELIFKFLLHQPTRKRLRQWGGRSRAMPKYKMDVDALELSPVHNN